MCLKIKSPAEFDSILEVATYFNDEKICIAYIEEWVWGGIIRCPDCKNVDVYRHKNGKTFTCKGRECNRQFTTLIGTIFEASKIPLSKWMMAMYLITANKKGINSCALARQIKITQKSAWFMLHRIRTAINQNDVKLSGVVQSDEAFCGGANGNRHIDKKYKFQRGRDYQDKVPILGMIEQGAGGRVKAIVLPKISAKYIRRGVLNSVTPGSILVSDEYGAYTKVLNRYYEQFSVNHSKRRFVSDEGFTTNAIENFWNHLKNMIRGVYIKLSRKHLQKYCDELTFRWNTMKLSEGQRLYELMTKLACRITYKQLIHEG